MVCSLGNYYSNTVLTDPGPGSVLDGIVIDVTSNSVEYGFYGTGFNAEPVSTPEPPVWMLLAVGMVGLLGFYSPLVRFARHADIFPSGGLQSKMSRLYWGAGAETFSEIKTLRTCLGV